MHLDHHDLAEVFNIAQYFDCARLYGLGGSDGGREFLCSVTHIKRSGKLLAEEASRQVDATKTGWT